MRILFLVWLLLGTYSYDCAVAQSISGESGGGIPESGSLSLANALAAAALDPSTGVLTSSLAIEVPAARGGPQPGVALTYNSAAGIREAGVGWGLTTPRIERQNRDGAPQYNDPPITQSNPSDPSHDISRIDRFVFDGRALVPICVVSTFLCRDGATDISGILPGWALDDGWVYFRLESDETHARFFWSPDRRTWRVQFVGGEILELGVPSVRPHIVAGAEDAAIDYDAVRTVAGIVRHPFRWNAVRRFDRHERSGSPVNLVVYRWSRLGQRERGYLMDVWDTPPVITEDTLIASDFEHHMHFSWQSPAFLRGLPMPGFRATPDLQLVGIDVTSQPFAKKTRQLLRRYHISYVSNGGNLYYLSTFEMEGRCAPIDELADGSLPETHCGKLPATHLRYSQPEHASRTGGIALPNPPPHAAGKPIPVTVLDVNGDSLPDFIETKQTSQPSGTQKLYFNGPAGYFAAPVQMTGPANFFSEIGRTVTGNVNSRLNGPASALWLATSAYWRTAGNPPGNSTWGGAEVGTASQTPAGDWFWSVAGPNVVNFYGGPNPFPGTRYSPFYEPGSPVPLSVVGDVDGDGLADGVFFRDASATVPPSYPADWRKNGETTTLSMGAIEYFPSLHVTSSYGPAPETVTSMKWEDGKVAAFLVDMNGDGLGDLAFVTMETAQSGRFFIRARYWPGDGRGNFTACTSDVCPATANGVEAESISFPKFEISARDAASITSDLVVLADVNGDGLADLIIVTPDALHIYYNFEGREWGSLTEPNISIPAANLSTRWIQNFPPRIQFADMNGNGLTDIVFIVGDEIYFFDVQNFSALSGWSTAMYSWAPRPGLLIGIDNGLGASTDVSYISTTDISRSKGNRAHPWSSPQAMQVVKTISVKSGLPEDEVQTTTYDYDNPAFDGHERRFRGFRNVSATRRLGKGTVRIDDTYYIGDGDAKWKTPLLIASEISDAHGIVHSTKVFSYAVQEMPMPYVIYSPEPGPPRWAYPNLVDTIIYDTTAWSPSSETTPVTISNGGREAFWTGTVPVRSRNHVRIRMEQQLDALGNVVWHVDRGRVKDDGTPIDQPVTRTVAMQPPRGDWKFLPESVFVSPFNGLHDLPRQRRFEYDALGQLKKVYATLTGTEALDRFHQDPSKPVAGKPASASNDGEILLSTTTYDDFGNVTLVEGSNAHCAMTAFDKDYADLPIENAQFSGGCGNGPIGTAAEWDRGFGAPTWTSKPDGSSSRVELDDFGRIVAAYAADPTSGIPLNAASSRIDYQVVEGGPVQRIKVTQSEGGGQTHTSWSYVDSLGRPVLTLNQADPAAGDGGQWVVNGMLQRQGGLVTAVYSAWFYTGDPANHPLLPLTSKRNDYDYEPFGRVSAIYALDGNLTRKRIYHALQLEEADAAGRLTVTALDGHGRIARTTVETSDDHLITEFSYEADGQISTVTKSHSNSDDVVERWFQYDSLGRNVLNVEPNTSIPTGEANTHLRAWRYAYDDSGALVGTSDARGCGENILRDGLGRMTGADFSPCLSSQQDYSPMDPATGAGAEVLNTYDVPEAGQTADFGVSSVYLRGRLAATRDRASHTRFGYDARGRNVSVARQISRPADQAPAGLLDGHYESHWSHRYATYDEANRVIEETTGAETAELLGIAGQSAVITKYTLRGLTKSIGGSYGTLVQGEMNAADGLPSSVQYADAARTSANFDYDGRRRLAHFSLSRPNIGPWTTAAGYVPPAGEVNTLQKTLLDTTFKYDAADNPILITDHRNPLEWPGGSAPVTRAAHYDEVDRLARVDYSYPNGSDIQADPLTLERTLGLSPAPESKATNRVLWQTFGYDWIGNLAKTNDDASLFYDRSLGQIGHGSPKVGPNQIDGVASKLSATFDPAGSLSDLIVQRSGPCTDDGGCFQRFHYDWDEVGQLTRARRWDFASAAENLIHSALPTKNANSDLWYVYNGSGSRVLKTSKVGTSGVHYTADIFPSLRLKNANWDDVAGLYTRTSASEIVNLAGFARVLHNPDLPSIAGNSQHVFLILPDHLGSAAAIIDRDTGELVERTSQQAYGGHDSDFRPARWGAFRQPNQFTGKEDDFEVGLTYFGARYYHALLGRFISADPLTIHALGGDTNPYAYSSASPLARIDLFGLDDCIGSECESDNRSSDDTSDPVVLQQSGSGDSSGGIPGNSGGGNPSGRRGSPPSRPSIPSSSAPTATKVLTNDLAWLAKAWIASNPGISSTVEAVTDPGKFARGYAKGLRDVVLGPSGGLTNALVAPVVSSAISGKTITVDKGELAAIAINTAITLVTMGRGSAASAEARAVAVEVAETVAEAESAATAERPTFLNRANAAEGTVHGVLTESAGQYNVVGSPEPLSGRFDFVVRNGNISIGRGHFVLAEGGLPVEFAGEVAFENGSLLEWNNVSGHYRPSGVFAPNAGLPIGKFINRFFPGFVGVPQVPMFRKP
jgi:RHS repeat-associated protein